MCNRWEAFHQSCAKLIYELTSKRKSTQDEDMAKACNTNETLSQLFEHLQIKSYKNERRPDSPDLMDQLPTLDDGSKGGFNTPEYKFIIPWTATCMPENVDPAFDYNLIKYAKSLYKEKEPEKAATVVDILVSTCILMKNCVKEKINTEFATEDVIRLRAHPNYRQAYMHVRMFFVVLNLYTNVQSRRSMGRRIYDIICNRRSGFCSCARDQTSRHQFSNYTKRRLLQGFLAIENDRHFPV
jgi:hypothetical protein